MKLRYWATFSIVALSVLLALVWVLVALEVGYIQQKNIISLIPYFIGATLLPFFIAVALIYISSIVSKKSFSIHRFHHRINWIALFLALIIFTTMAVKKVNISNEVENKTDSVIAKKSELSSEKILDQMEKNCVKSHTPVDGFNKAQILLYCECIVDDAKTSLTNKEIRTVTRLLATKETSNAAFLENHKIAGIVVQCIWQVDRQYLVGMYVTQLTRP